MSIKRRLSYTVQIDEVQRAAIHAAMIVAMEGADFPHPEWGYDVYATLAHHFADGQLVPYDAVNGLCP